MSDLSLVDLANPQDEDLRRAKRKRHRRRRAVVLLIALLLFVGAATAAYLGLKPVVLGFLEPTDFEGPGNGEVVVQIEAGDSGTAIAQTLADAGVVKTSSAFVDAYQGEPEAGSIQPGSYALRQQMKASDAVALLLDPAARVALRVTVPEGLRKEDVLDLLAVEGGFSREVLASAAAEPETIGLPPAAEGNPEGFLYPATYDFEPDATPAEVLSIMIDRSIQQLEEIGVPPDRYREVVTKASLVEAEARLPEDFGRVARVFDNRLAAGMPLQLDSTVLFAVGKKSVTTTPQDRDSDSPYNTYKFPGLPAGPINSPGAAAMQAAFEPTPGEWLYFVTVDPDTGETRYAVTFEEHQANVAVFQQWLRDNPDR